MFYIHKPKIHIVFILHNFKFFKNMLRVYKMSTVNIYLDMLMIDRFINKQSKFIDGYVLFLHTKICSNAAYVF